MAVKDALREAVERGREREVAELHPQVDDRPAPTPGLWTVRDTVAHLSAWRQHAVEILDAARTGARAPRRIEDTDEENARIYASVKDLAAQRVLDAARESWQSLLRALDGCSEEVLLSPRPGWAEFVTWSAVPGNAYGHLAEHLGYLAQERGDTNAAEEAARWAHGLDVRISPDGPERGNADYNLACFFARSGRAAEALPLLRGAFERNPPLKAWAQKDKDLDRIREQAEVRPVLA